MVYTAVAEETVLLKDVRLSWESGAVTRAVVGLQSGALNVQLIDQPIGNNGTVGMTPWVVLAAGESLGVFSQGGTFTYWFSGAELEGHAD